jgi:photosystem II stability/assembly factor-like uncharacterized protein
MLRFVDQKHGWAVQDTKLLATSDGENWEQTGKVPDRFALVDHVFLSPREGLLLEGNKNETHMLQTKDRGRTWKEILPRTACHAKIQVQGLSRETTCVLWALHFPSAKIGYAVGGTADDFNTLFLGKTEDGGNTWSFSSLPDIGPVWAGGAFTPSLNVFFIDENAGFLNMHDSAAAKFLATSDGGQSWHALVASPGPNLRFADPEVGWALDGSKFTYTTDGGKHWSSRQLSFPAGAHGFSLPRRDRGYIVGDHGMVYRYRVVPLDYKVKGMIDAPLMPSYGGPLLGHLQDMKTQVAALQKKLGAASGSSVRLPPAMYGGGRDSEDSSSSTVEIPQAGQSAPAAGGFVQDTSDVPPSPFVQNCCAPQVQSMQSSFGSFSKEVPSFGSRFRSLNLVLAGLNLVSDLTGKRKGIGDSFAAFKQATDAQTANTALQGLSGNLNNTQQAISMGFSNFSAASLAADAAGAAGTVQNAATAASNPNTVPTTQPGTQDADKAAADAKKKAADAKKAADDLKNKLKKKLPF